MVTNSRLCDMVPNPTVTSPGAKVMSELVAHDEAWMTVYHAYCGTYRHDQWAERVRTYEEKTGSKESVLPPGLRCISVGARDCRLLAKIAKTRVISGRAIGDLELYADLSDGLKQACDPKLYLKDTVPATQPIVPVPEGDLCVSRDGLCSATEAATDEKEDNVGGVFVKLSTTSAKNEGTIKRCHTVQQVLEAVTDAPTLLGDLERAVQTAETLCVIVMPWNEALQRRGRKWEFRVFVCDAAITAISQQVWSECVKLTAEDMHAVAFTVCKWYDSVLSARLPFSSAVLDIWIDDNQCPHLIEANPWGNWSSSGSSLFHWRHDHSLLYQPHTVSESTISTASTLTASTPTNSVHLAFVDSTIASV
jgi:hypothetical protein